jgi:hypothetical protein
MCACTYIYMYTCVHVASRVYVNIELLIAHNMTNDCVVIPLIEDKYLQSL